VGVNGMRPSVEDVGVLVNGVVATAGRGPLGLLSAG